MKRRLYIRSRSLCWCFLAVLLWLEGACLSKRDYEKLRALDAIEAYEAYLQQHKDSPYTSRIVARLEELYFEKAEEENTYTAYASFALRFPNGPHARIAQERAEDIRAREMGIHLYRRLPEDYYETLSGIELPFRILVEAADSSTHNLTIEAQWYEEFATRDVLVPLDPRKPVTAPPDLTLRVRESTVTFFTTPWPMVEAALWAGQKLIRNYKVAGTSVRQCVLYELVQDHEAVGKQFRIPKSTIQTVETRFARALSHLPLQGSLSIEYEHATSGSQWDRMLLTEFTAFLRNYPLCTNLLVYERGHPPERAVGHKAFLRVDPDNHAPVFSSGIRFRNDLPRWSVWNSKRIVLQKDFFFLKMLLDILDYLVFNGILTYAAPR